MYNRNRSRQEQVGRNSPSDGEWQIDKDLASTSKATVTNKEWNIQYVYMWTVRVQWAGLYLDLLLPQTGVILEVQRITASQDHWSCQLVDKRAEKGYCNKSDVILCIKYLKDCFGWSVMHVSDKEERKKEDNKIRSFQWFVFDSQVL